MSDNAILSAVSASLALDLERLYHPLVRDLAWLLHAPDLLSTRYPGRPPLAELGLADPSRRMDWLKDLEQQPGELEHYVSASLHGRLGLYHERLWQFMLDHAPSTRLLAHNVPVREARRTLGELDLLYVTEDSAIVHLEVALKFYLGLPEGPGNPSDPARWIGPGSVDSLAIKTQRTLTHQLPLARQPQATAALEEILSTHTGPACALRQRLAMPGVLFQRWQQNIPAPDGAADGALYGHWLPVDEWPALRAALPGFEHGARLGKPHWLAPPRIETLLDCEALEESLIQHFLRWRAPCQLVLYRPPGEWLRLFVVGSCWPDSLPLPPH
ncbi:DUF1853 family protein [Halomonas sp. WWR20]